MRLGCPARLYGLPAEPTLQGAPDPPADALGTELAFLRDALRYLAAQRITMFRLNGSLVDALATAWAAGHGDGQRATLDALGQEVHAAGLRLSFHAHSGVALSTPNDEQAFLSIGWVTLAAAVFDALDLSPEAAIVVHTGGAYGDAPAALQRFARRYEALPTTVRGRLVLENDGRRYSHADVARVHEACGIPLVFDVLHHRVHNPEGVPMREALDRSLASWPSGVTPKVHFCTPRSEARGLGTVTRLKVPTWTEHGDFANPFEFAEFVALCDGMRPCDVMLESKAHDLALLKLRDDLARYAPAVAAALS